MARPVGDTGDVHGFVDPRPAQEAERRELQARLAAATDEEERGRLHQELIQLERSMGRGRGLRWLLLGWRRQGIPW